MGQDKRTRGGGSVSKRTGQYNASIKSATETLVHKASKFHVVHTEVKWIREREKLLVDFIRYQEEIERILQQQEAMLAEIEASPDPAAAAGRSVFGQVTCSTWCTQIVAHITVGLIMYVKGLTCRDWCEAGCKSFMEQSALLELCNRELQPEPQVPTALDQPDGAAVAAVTAAAAAAEGWSRHNHPPGSALPSTGNTAGGSAGGGTEPCQHNSQPQTESMVGTGTATTAAATTATAAAAGGVATHSQDPLESLRTYMETSTQAVLAAMFYNPQPYYAAAACNLSTGCMELMPQGHLVRVVQRLGLSPRQVMHLRIINTEFVRLARATSQEGESLVEQAASVSLSAVAHSFTKSSSGAAGSANATAGGQARAAASGAAAAAAAAGAAHADAGAAAGADAAAAAAAGAGISHANSGASRQGSGGLTQAAAAAGAVAAAVDDEGDAAAADDGAAVAGCQAGETAGEALSRQLDRYLAHIHIHTVVTAMCVVNTLTPRQMATFAVASFPYAPNVHALAEACMHDEVVACEQQPQPSQPPPPARPSSCDLDEEQQKQQQEQQQQEQQEQQQQRGVPKTLESAWSREVDTHMAARDQQLTQQVLEFWQGNGGLLGSLAI